MFMVASSVVLTVVVLNYHHRTADIHEMPQWVSIHSLRGRVVFFLVDAPGEFLVGGFLESVTFW